MARKLASWTRPPSAATKRMAKYAKILEREMSDALGEATYTVRDAAKKRTFQTRSVGASDSITGKPKRMAGQSPVRTKVYRADQRGTVSAVPYYTYARTRGLTSLLTRLGRRDALARPGLVVNPAKRGNYLQRKAALKGKKPRLIEFAQNPGLKAWALKRKMLGRQKIYLGDAETIHLLVTRPALAKNVKKVRSFYEKAFIKAGASF
jgi:hypothetical protein